MKKMYLAIALTASLASTSALANAEPSFDFVTGSYASLDIYDTDVDGFELEYSQSFTDNVFGYATGNFFSEDGANKDTYSLGVGYRVDVAQGTAVYGIASFLRDEEEHGQWSVDDNGYAATLGVRHALNEHVEFDAYARHVDIWDDTDQYLGVRAKVYFTPAWALQAGYQHIDGETSITTLGVSYNF